MWWEMATFVKIWKSMSHDLAEQLARISHKAELLATRYRLVDQRRKDLQEQVAALEKDLLAERKKSQQLAREAEYLRLSAAIAPDTAAAREARAYLSDLVREIDSCVETLMRGI